MGYKGLISSKIIGLVAILILLAGSVQAIGISVDLGGGKGKHHRGDGHHRSDRSWNRSTYYVQPYQNRAYYNQVYQRPYYYDNYYYQYPSSSYYIYDSSSGYYVPYTPGYYYRYGY